MQNRYTHGKKHTIKRVFSLTLACLMLGLSLPILQPAEAADDGMTTDKVYEWHAITCQADVPAVGTYPMILCYETFEGVQYYLKGRSLNNDGGHHMYRDGIGSAKSGFPTTVQKRFDNWLQNAEAGKEWQAKLDADASNKSQYNKDLAAARDAYLNSPEAPVKDLYIVRHWQKGASQSSYDSNYVNATQLTAEEKQKTGINMEEDSFITSTLPTDWSLQVRKRASKWFTSDLWGTAGLIESGVIKDEEHIGESRISIICQNKYLTDICGTWWQSEIDWCSSGDIIYELNTHDTFGSRNEYTAPGWCQIYWYDKHGDNSGLCFDGNHFGCVEDGTWCYSMFRLYYGVEKTLSTITTQYTLPSGAFLNASDNLKICEGASLTIEPGAILSVTGNLILNGVINNCGTVVLNPGATITTLQPKYDNCAQINCFGGDTVDFTSIVWDDLDEETRRLALEMYDLDTFHLEKEIRYAEQNLQMTVDAFNYCEEYGYPPDATMTHDKALELIAYYEKRKAMAEQAYNDQLNNKDNILLDMAGYIGHKTYFKYSGCQGELIILKGAMLAQCAMQNSTLNLFPGSVCVNDGTLVCPRGMMLYDAEYKGLEGSHTFIGYEYPTASRSSNGNTVLYPNTKSATLDGLTSVDTGDCNITLFGNYHFASEGVMRINGVFCSDMSHPLLKNYYFFEIEDKLQESFYFDPELTTAEYMNALFIDNPYKESGNNSWKPIPPQDWEG